MRLQHPLLLKSYLEEKEAEDTLLPRYRHCHSRLAARCARFPSHQIQHQNTAEDQGISTDSEPHAIVRALGRSSGPVVGSQASIEGTTGVSPAKLVHRLGVASTLVTGTRADTCRTKHHHRGPRRRHGHSVQDTPIRSSAVPSAALYPKDITTTGGV
jgi:hypothetical protein